MEKQRDPGQGSRCFSSLLVEGWIGVVDVFLVQLFPHLLHSAAKALEVDDFPFPEEADDVGDVRVVLGQAQDVVVSHSGFLLGGHVLGQVGDGVSLDADARRCPGAAGGRGGVDARGVIDKVSGKPRVVLNLLIGEAAGQLVDDGRHHLHVA